MWVWDQSAGTLSRNGKTVATGYSGHDAGKNNPAMETVRNVGPIPAGNYKIGAPYTSDKTGPYTLRLEPVDARVGDDTDQRTGRGAFRIHGDSARAPGTASHGCIILARPIREAIWNSGDRDLQVVH